MCLLWLGSCDYRAGNVQHQLVQLSWLQRRQWMLLRGARLFFCNRMADDQVAASGGKEDLKRGRTRGTPGSPSRTEEDTLTDFATSVFRGRFSYRGFCLTLMAFRINEETLAGEIFQLARASNDGDPSKLTVAGLGWSHTPIPRMEGEYSLQTKVGAFPTYCDWVSRLVPIKVEWERDSLHYLKPTSWTFLIFRSSVQLSPATFPPPSSVFLIISLTPSGQLFQCKDHFRPSGF